MRRALIFLATALFAIPALANDFRHGISVFGDLKYPADFKHLDYVNPSAPKGGTYSEWGIRPFDNLNPFILKGVQPLKVSDSFGIGYTFATLMAAVEDEPDSLYGYVAEAVQRDPANRFVRFRLREAAQFHDGTPIRAEDVAFTFNLLISKGHPQYRIQMRGVAAAVVESPRIIRFDFNADATRDLPVQVAGLPVLSKAEMATRSFEETTLAPLLGSGPYKVERADSGRSIVYRRVENWWGADLPVMRGRWNFEFARTEIFRDRDIALEAFFAGAYDFREEFTARSWTTGYDKPPVNDGRIQRMTLPDNTPSGYQAFFLNLRRAKFQDARVREAIGLAFDFEWTNKNLFNRLYNRTSSIFQNSELAATGEPSPAELALLDPLREQIPAQVFGPAYIPPKTDGSGNNRDNLRKAQALLLAAGYRSKDGRLVHGQSGEQLAIEYLSWEPTMERIVQPILRNLERLGIKASIRHVDPSQYELRMRSFDYDVTTRRTASPLTPGIELRNYWSSSSAGIEGSLNLAGIRNPAIDALVEAALAAKDRPSLIAAARALDRVVMWSHFAIPQWYKAAHHVAFWDKFGRPPAPPKYGMAVVDTWWIDPAKEAALASRSR
ncbi:extracellular solute-binding protein [Desertibaculum subflavum]|uniref:extracellular solute-binding protein n=1 Tax=Desertibaculum subflavum TaxID=2268458 RepID=UPI000E66460E